MLHVASFGILEAGALIGVLGALIGGLAALRKIGPEKDALYITSAQGAAVIMNSLIATLREEIDRGRLRTVGLEAEIERLTAENERLATENKGLRRKRGERHDDPSS